jgi:hypothetical protein
MVLIELEEVVRVEDLELGNIFGKDELIIRINQSRTRMVTIAREDIEFADGIRRFYYNIVHDGKKVLALDNEGYGDLSPDAVDYKEYDKRLKEKEL